MHSMLRTWSRVVFLLWPFMAALGGLAWCANALDLLREAPPARCRLGAPPLLTRALFWEAGEWFTASCILTAGMAAFALVGLYDRIRRRPQSAATFMALSLGSYAINFFNGVAQLEMINSDGPVAISLSVELVVLGCILLIGPAQWLRDPSILAPPRRFEAGCCVECGYNLTGIRSARCPECGTAVERRHHRTEDAAE